MKLKFTVEGLDCPVCASKLATKMAEIEGVENVKINFLSEKLTVETELGEAELLPLLRKVAKDGIILLTDSDGGGRQIRSYLHGILGKDTVHDAYIPKIEGKEKRKKAPSKAGLLGVEGVGREALVRALSPYVDTDGAQKDDKRKITKTDLYLDGLSGAEGSKERRAMLLSRLMLPDDMSAGAMLEALNLLTDYDTYKTLVDEIS